MEAPPEFQLDLGQTHRIALRREREKDSLQLGKFDGADDFADVFRRFVEGLRTAHANDELGQRVQHTQSVNAKNDQVWGIIRAGDYGFTADIVDADTLANRFKREPGDAQLLPFYFLLRATNSSKSGVLLVQRFGVHGVYTSFMNSFREWFRTQYPDFTFDVARLIPAKVIEQLLMGGLKSIELQTFEVAADITTKVKAFGNLGKTGKVTVRIDAPRKGFLLRPDWLQKIVEGRIKLIEVQDTFGWNDDQIRIEVEFNGSTRKIDFQKPDSIAPYVDITDDVTVGDDGHPVFASIHKIASNLMDDLVKEIGA